MTMPKLHNSEYGSFPPFCKAPLTRVLPQFYWDVYSAEQRIKEICIEISKIEQYLNLVSDTINEILTRYDSYQEQIDALWVYIHELEVKFQASQDAQTAELKKYVDDSIAAFDGKFDSVNKRIDALKAYVDARDAEILTYIDNQIDYVKWLIEQAKHDQLEIFDPTYGSYRPTGTVVNRVYDFDRYFGIRCKQFDGLAQTVTTIDSHDFTAHWWDTHGKDFKPKGNYSPVTGKFVSLYQITLDLAGLHRSSWNALGFDNMGYTVVEFESLDWNAFYFDFYNYTGVEDSTFVMKHNILATDFETA